VHRVALVFAYLGGAVVAAVGIMSAASIAGRTLLGRPLLGDFELVEIGTAVAGSLFLPYCQAARGHVIVDVFTARASAAVVAWLDRAGALLIAATFLFIGWRTVAGCVDIARSGESSMLMQIPIWIGYAAIVPGVLGAGVIALAQAVLGPRAGATGA
jgi:TRAP-type C4-dicarboxylate transport system permease small subunit